MDRLGFLGGQTLIFEPRFSGNRKTLAKIFFLNASFLSQQHFSGLPLKCAAFYRHPCKNMGVSFLLKKRKA